MISDLVLGVCVCVEIIVRNRSFRQSPQFVTNNNSGDKQFTHYILQHYSDVSNCQVITITQHGHNISQLKPLIKEYHKSFISVYILFLKSTEKHFTLNFNPLYRWISISHALQFIKNIRKIVILRLYINFKSTRTL